MHANVESYTLQGSFNGLNGTLPVMNGQFTLTNSSDSTNTLLRQGNIQCYRDPAWAWWRQSINPWWMFLLVPAFSFFLSLWNLQPLKSKQMPVMVIIGCAGWVCNYFANQFVSFNFFSRINVVLLKVQALILESVSQIFDRSDVVSFLGAFVIGLLGNLYSRIFKGTAFTRYVFIKMF